MTDQNNANEERLRRAMAAVLRLQERNAELEQQRSEPIAIVAMACRLPGGIETPEQFWDLLAAGGDAIGPFPQRWADIDLYDPSREAAGKCYASEGGFLDGADEFDPEFFGISPREALLMDPQQRVVLQTSWEVLERAGVRPDSLAGSRTGVYLGAMRSDYGTGQAGLDALDGYQGTGISGGVVSGRLSYVLGLQGPAITVDTGCSSSLVALHTAAGALRGGECDAALAGGVTVLCSPSLFVESSRLGALSPDGRCKSFAAGADGGGWSEGCAVVLLKRLSTARRDGDRVLAVIRGSAVNQDGRSQGLTAPNGPAQQRVIRDALAAANLTPADIDVLEAHGTGTPLGDLIEAGALVEVFGGREVPLWLGSAKSNIGHTQAAAGVSSLLKMVLALQHESLPRTLHADQPNPKIPWQDSGLALVQQDQPWPRGQRPRRAGISSFGISGTNAHLVVEEAPEPAPETAPEPGTEPEGVVAQRYPLLLSGHDQQALRAQARRWADWLTAEGDRPVRPIAVAAATRRAALPARAAVLAADTAEAVRGLTALAGGAPDDAVVTGDARERGKVVFVFPGHGSQWREMAQGLLAESAVFAATVDECDAELRRWTGWSVREVLQDNGSALPFDRLDVLQPALFTVAIGLAAVWRSLGIEPAAVVGSSQGEVAAAVVSGALSLADAAKIVVLRSTALLRECSGRGAMALLGMPSDEVGELIAEYGDALSVALVNTAESTVVAGDPDAVDALVARMSGRDVFCRKLNAPAAGHCAHVDPILPGLRTALADLRPRPTTVPFYSTVTGAVCDGERLDAGYWCANLRETVRMDRALAALVDAGFGVFVEVSAHPVLGMPLTSAVAGHGGVVVGTLQRDRGDLAQVLRALGELHCHGGAVDWSAVLGDCPPDRLPALPTYAFARRRYWYDAPTVTGGGPVLPEAEPCTDVAGFAALPPAERLAALTAAVQAEAAAVLGATEPVAAGKRLADLGLDSIMALRLRNRLTELTAVALPGNLAFNCPTPAAIAEHLAAETPADTGPALDRATGCTTYPGTDGQRRLWFLEQLRPGTAEYNAPLRLRVPAPLDAGLLTRALHWVAGRHEALRTGLEWRDGDLVQVVHDAPDITVATVPETVARQQETEPFDLTAGAPLRVCLIDRPDGGQTLSVTLHHAVVDGWSLAVLLPELSAAYAAFARGTEPELPPVAHQLGDYADWERRAGETGHFDAALRGFAAELAGLPAPELPAAGSTEDAGGTVEFEVPAELRADLEALADQAGVTPYTAYLSAFAVLLSRYTGQPDFGIGTVWANRELAGLAGTVGFLVNTLPVRCDLTGEPSFADLLASLAPRVRELSDRQSVPLSEVVRVAGAQRSGDEQPLFRALFNYRGQGLPALGDWELSADTSISGMPRGVAKSELGLTLAAGGTGLRGELEYLPHVFDQDGAHRMVANFGALLAALVAEPQRPVAEVALLSATEQHWLAARGGAVHQPQHQRTALDLVLDQVRRTPDAVALVDDNEELTYRGLADRAAAVAAALRAAGAGPLVGVYLPRSVDLAVAVLATWLAGAAYVPLDPEYPPARVAQVIEDSGLDVVLTHSTVPTGDLAARTVVMDTVRAEPQDDVRPEPTGLAYVIYTSGSTGRPKGVAIEHRQFANFCAAMDTVAGGGSGDTWLAVTSLSFDISTVELLWTLTRGYRVVVAGTGAAGWSEYREHRPTHLQCTPSLAKMLLADAAGRALLAGLDRLLVGGEALDSVLAGKLLACCGGTVTNMYGPTETTVWSAAWPVQPGPVSLGSPLLNNRLAVLDAAGQPVPRGGRGELYIGGHGVARGYLDRPELTAERFVPDPVTGATMYRTGDVVRYRADGSLEFCGRADAQIKLHGHRIELGEIDTVCAAHPAVADCAAVVRDDELVLYWVAAAGRQADPGPVREHLAARLPGYMVPGRLIALPELPHTPNKKIDRNALAALLAPAAGTVHTGQSTVDGVDAVVARVLATVLGVPDVDHDTGIFDLGATSMTALRAHQQLCAELGREFPLATLFRYPTVRKLAAFLRDGAAAVEVRDRAQHPADDAIAVVGLACRLPGAPDAETFWANLCGGVESITTFTDEELLAAGVAPELLTDPDYVRCRAVLDGADLFDAGFFGYSAAEAEAMDPQHRLLLECAWQAFEDAGVVPQRFDGAVAVYAGSGFGGYPQAPADDLSSFYRTMIGTKNDYLATRLAHAFDLRGPALTVQTACSTGLVAVHLARESLLRGEADLALVGASSLTIPLTQGFRYQEGLVVSADGACRAFDAQGNGTVFGSGVGALVLRRLSDARAAGDAVYAVIRGSAVNNDGADKVGFTAPSVHGQARVIAEAQAVAGVDPAGVGMVEAHGTATALGDPIEVQALQEVFGAGRRSAPCALGSVKTNIGHADATAGIAGLLKAILCVHHGMHVPSLHFDAPNPELGLDPELFAVNTALRPWRQDGPRRAGVSSFGIGGTNAHVVLEQAPDPEQSTVDGAAANAPVVLGEGTERELSTVDGAAAKAPAVLGQAAESESSTVDGVAGNSPVVLGDGAEPEPVAEPELFTVDGAAAPILVSGRTEAALREQAGRWARWLTEHQDHSVAAIAETARRRAHFPHRAAITAATPAGVVDALHALAADRPHPDVLTGVAGEPGRVAFVFPGQGAEWSGMAIALLEDNAAFAAAVAACDAALQPHTGWSVAALLRDGGDTATIDVAQPALFTMYVALAAAWRAGGVQPAAVVGHSQGEIAAAVVAGALTLEEGARLVAARSRTLAGVAGAGEMAFAELPVEQLRARIARYGGAVSIAAVNTATSTALSGEPEAITELLFELDDEDVVCGRLAAPVASHSHYMDPLLPGLRDELAALAPQPGTVAFYSTVTGDLLPGTALDADYWCRNLREPVRLDLAQQQLLAAGIDVFLEVSPHPVLAMPLSECGEGVVTGTLRRGHGGAAELLRALGVLHVHGYPVDWRQVCGDRPLTARLPGYAFQRERYWIDPPQPVAATVDREFWQTVQDGDARRLATLLGAPQQAHEPLAGVLPLLSAWRHTQDAEAGLAGWLYDQVWEQAPLPAPAPSGPWVLVSTEDQAAVVEDVAAVLHGAGVPVHRLAAVDDRDALAAGLAAIPDPAAILTFGSLDDDLDPGGSTPGFRSTLALIQAATAPVWALTSGAVDVTGAEGVAHPLHGLVLGLGRSAALEEPARWGGVIDLPTRHYPGWAADVIAAVTAGDHEDQVALRDGQRFVRRLRRAAASAAAGEWTTGGTALITGGQGALGVHLARWLAQRGAQRIVLASRRADACEEVTALRAELGVAVDVLPCDVTDERQVKTLVAEIDTAHCPLTVVAHLAGVSRLTPLAGLTAQQAEQEIAAKLLGARYLDEAVGDRRLDAFLLYGSGASLWGSAGQAAYGAANTALDALAHHRRGRGLAATVLHWGGWAGGGMVSAEADALARSRGLRSMAPALALRGLDMALRTSRTALGVADIDWSRFAPTYCAARPRPLLAGIEDARRALEADTADAGAAETLRADLAARPVAQRAGVVTELVTAEVAAVLGTNDVPAAQPLQQLGFDSLMAVTVRGRLARRTGVPVTTAAILQHGSCAGIAGHLLAELLPACAPAVTPAVAQNPWLRVLKPADRPHGRVLCVAGMGGTTGSFAALVGQLPDGVELLGVQLPGREARTGEPAETDMMAVADHVLAALSGRLDLPLVLYGHSQGAWLCWELAHRLAHRPGAPAHGLLPACALPPLAEPTAGLHRLAERTADWDALSTAQAAEVLRDILPDEVTGNAELLTEYIARLRADTALADSHRAAVTGVRRKPLPIPVFAVSATADPVLPDGAMDVWRELTTGRFEPRAIDGTHAAPVVNAPQMATELMHALHMLTGEHHGPSDAP